MTYVGLARAFPPMLADANHARQLLALGFADEAFRILVGRAFADRNPIPELVEVAGLISDGDDGEAIHRLDVLVASHALA